MLNIGLKLQLTRLQKGITQKELAARSGIPQSNISNFEKGKRDLTVTSLLRCCYALEIHPEALFGEEKEEQSHFRLGRARVERIAAYVIGKRTKLPQPDREIAECLKTVLVGGKKGYVSQKNLTIAWHELKRRFTREELDTLSGRVSDALKRAA